jgi:hypothetical protein
MVSLAPVLNSKFARSVYPKLPDEEIPMGLMDVLGQYSREPYKQPPHVIEDFDQVTHEVAPEDLEDGLVDAFQADETPPFEDMVGQLYDRSDDDTRAGLLNEILGSLPGGLAGGLAGGALGGLLQRFGQGNPRISPRDAHDIPARDVQVAAREAAKTNPGVLQKVGRFYARHPQIVQVLGQAALGIMMRNLARRRRF